jgi:hypothetical protein
LHCTKLRIWTTAGDLRLLKPLELRHTGDVHPILLNGQRALHCWPESFGPVKDLFQATRIPAILSP